MTQKENKYISNNTNLLQEWNYEKNINQDPRLIALCSNKKFWWKCSVCRYEWQASPNSRHRGNGCPMCGKLKAKETINIHVCPLKMWTLLKKFNNQIKLVH